MSKGGGVWICCTFRDAKGGGGGGAAASAFYCQSSFVSLGGHQQLCSLIRPLGLDPKAAACR